MKHQVCILQKPVCEWGALCSQYTQWCSNSIHIKKFVININVTINQERIPVIALVPVWASTLQLQVIIYTANNYTEPAVLYKYN